MYGAETWIWMQADINRLMAVEMRFIRTSVEGKSMRKKIGNEKMEENLKVSILEGRLIH
jgi:hypothetical protein